MPEIKSNGDYFWTIKEISQFLKMSPNHLRSYIQSHKKTFPVARRPTNGHARYIKDEVIQWATQQRTK